MSNRLNSLLQVLNASSNPEQEKLSLVVLCAISHLSYNKAQAKMPWHGVSCDEVIAAIGTFTLNHAVFKYQQPEDLKLAVTEATFMLMMHHMVGFNAQHLEFGAVPTVEGASIATHLIKEGELIKGCKLVKDYEQFEAEAANAVNN